MLRALLFFALFAAACSSSETDRCASGRVCPSGSVCVDEADVCATPDQVEACDGLEQGATCAFEERPGECLDSACIPDVCGDGRVSPSEACDSRAAIAQSCEDLGFNPGELACDTQCRLVTSGCDGACGDGITDASEDCDGAAPLIECAFGSATCTDDCNADLRDCVRLGWSAQRIGDDDLVSVTVLDRSTAFAASQSALYRFDGVSWALATNAPTSLRPIVDVFSYTSDEVWVASKDGHVARFDGASWDLLPDGPVDDIASVVASDGRVVVAGPGGSATHGEDGWRDLGRAGRDLATAAGLIFLASAQGTWTLLDGAWQAFAPGDFDYVAAGGTETVVAARALSSGGVRVGWMSAGRWRTTELLHSDLSSSTSSGIGLHAWDTGALVVGDRGVFHLAEAGWFEMDQRVEASTAAGAGPGFTVGVGPRGLVWYFDGLNVDTHEFPNIVGDDIDSSFERLHARTRNDLVFNRRADSSGTRYQRRQHGVWEENAVADDLGLHSVVWGGDGHYATTAFDGDASYLAYVGDSPEGPTLLGEECCYDRAVGRERGALTVASTFIANRVRSEALAWAVVSEGTYFGGCAFENGDALLFGDDGVISIRGGAASSIPEPLGGLVNDIECFADGTATAVGPSSDDANLFRWVGETWVPIPGPPRRRLERIAASSPADVFVVAASEFPSPSSLWHWNGAGWREVSLPGDIAPSDVELGGSSHDVFVSGYSASRTSPNVIVEITRVRPW